jgi:hypothetical protein
MAEQFDAKPAEIPSLFNNNLEPVCIALRLMFCWQSVQAGATLGRLHAGVSG